MSLRGVSEAFVYASEGFSEVLGDFYGLLRVSGELESDFREFQKRFTAFQGFSEDFRSIYKRFRSSRGYRTIFEGYKVLRRLQVSFRVVSGGKGFRGVSRHSRGVCGNFKKFQTDCTCRTDDLFTKEFLESLKQVLESLLDSSSCKLHSFLSFYFFLA